MPRTAMPGLLDMNQLMPGQVSNTEYYRAQTCFSLEEDVDPALGGIPFGRGVALRADKNTDMTQYDRLVVRLPDATDTKAVGVAINTFSVVGILNGKPDDYDHPRGYFADIPFGVVYQGLIGVEVTEPVNPSTPVYMVTIAGMDHGKFSASATGGAIEVPNASWRGSAEAGGACALYLNLTV